MARPIPPQAADYDAYIAALTEFSKGTDPAVHCRRCEGSGLLSTADDEDAWHVWATLPPGSDLAVAMGVVTSKPCPECNGTGLCAAA